MSYNFKNIDTQTQVTRVALLMSFLLDWPFSKPFSSQSRWSIIENEIGHKLLEIGRSRARTTKNDRGNYRSLSDRFAMVLSVCEDNTKE